MGAKNNKLGNFADNSGDFSIAVGGPLYKFYMMTCLSDSELNLLPRRMFAIVMFTWLPLFILSALNGEAFSGVRVPFIQDLDVQVRFLGALSLLLLAEVIVHQKIRDVISQFLARDIILPAKRIQFADYVISAIKLRDSYYIELFIFIFAASAGHLLWNGLTSLDISTWYESVVNGKEELNLAGYWYVFISLPVFQFILLRWYFRIFVWYRLVWKISGLQMNLNALHPDRAGGLSFMEHSITAFLPVLLAHSLLIAGYIMNRIWHDGRAIQDFKLEVFGILAVLMVFVLLPLTFFIFPMVRAKFSGVNKYGVLASNYVNLFRKKWIEDPSADFNSILGAQDIQALADLSTSYTTTREMGIVPFRPGFVVQLIFIVSLPIFPIVLTTIPLIDILKRVAEIFF